MKWLEVSNIVALISGDKQSSASATIFLMVSKITILKFLIQMRPILCIQIYFLIRRCCWGTEIVATSKIFM